jgi:hypothetical protein
LRGRDRIKTKNIICSSEKRIEEICDIVFEDLARTDNNNTFIDKLGSKGRI